MNSLPARCARLPTNRIATVTSSCPCASDSERIERKPFSFESEFDTLKRPANFPAQQLLFKFRISRIGVHIHVQIRALAEHRRKQDLAKNIFSPRPPRNVEHRSRPALRRRSPSAHSSRATKHRPFSR